VKIVDESPVRFVHVGGVSREANIKLPEHHSASEIMLMRCDAGSVSRAALDQKHLRCGSA
jgi:hypothetical protein